MSYSLIRSPSQFRAMVRLAAPVLAEETLTLLVGWTDLWLVGQYVAGDASKAAMGLMSYTMWLIPSMFAAVSIGTVAVVSRYVGADKGTVANWFANQAFSIGIFFCLVATAVAWFFHQPFIASMNLEGESGELATRYLGYIIPIIPLIMVQQVGAACLRGAGDTVTGLVIKAIVVLINVAVSIALVTGAGPAPLLGWDGIALGTAIGHATGGLILLTLVIRGRAGIRLRASWMVPRYSVVKKLLRVGLPGGSDIAAVLFCQLVFVSFINSLGTLAAASHAVAIQIEAVSYMPGIAFQVAAATMAGQFLGARLPEKAMRSVVICTLSGLAVICASGVMIYFFAELIAGFFIGTGDGETLRLTARLLRIVCWAMPALAVVMVLSGALRGAGDTRWPFLITLFGFLVIRIPLAWWLAMPEINLGGFQIPGGGYGVQGAWYAMLIDLFVRSVLLGLRTSGGKWLAIKV